MRRLYAALAVAALASCAPADTPLTVLDEPRAGERWQVINYWAIWCAPCREEIPELNSLAHRGLVDVYAVNFDEVQGELLIEQALELDIQFPLLSADPGPALGSARPTVLPTTLIVSPDGEVATRLIGPQTAASLEAEIAHGMRQARGRDPQDTAEG